MTIRSSDAAGRKLATVPDTLVYRWNDKIFLRDTVWGSQLEGIVRVLDTTWNPAVVYGFLLDERDRQTYRTVKIGSTTWLAQNLNYAGIEGDTGLCYQRDPANCAKWGRLYLWRIAMAGSTQERARGLCPAGWHVPTLAEWNGLQTEARKGGLKSGPRLRATSSWTAGTTATDALGFRALASGNWEKTLDSFGNASYYGAWFTSTSPASFITEIALGCQEDSLWQVTKEFGRGSSLRCAKD